MFLTKNARFVYYVFICFISPVLICQQSSPSRVSPSCQVYNVEKLRFLDLISNEQSECWQPVPQRGKQMHIFENQRLLF